MSPPQILTFTERNRPSQLRPVSNKSTRNLDRGVLGPLSDLYDPSKKELRPHTLAGEEELQYLKLLADVLQSGEEREDRTGVGTYSLFGASLTFSLRKYFPLLTTKKLHFKSIVYELLWFLRGDTNVKFLQENGVRIWNEWADEKGELGPIYGAQWRKWQSKEGSSIDQIALLIERLNKAPFARRHILISWNVGELAAMALPPCHVLAQFYVSKAGGLSCQFYQRSADLFLGLPFNIASYALLTTILAKTCNLFPEKLHFVGGDVHVYKNHVEQVQTQLSREPYSFPSLKVTREMKGNPDPVRELEKIQYTDFELSNYQCHPPIPAPIAV